MRIHSNNPDLLTTALHATLAREAALLTHRLRGALQDPPLIDVTLTHRPDREDYTVHLLLRLEDRDLTATGEGSTPGVAIRDAFDALADAITPCIVARRRPAHVSTAESRSCSAPQCQTLGCPM